MHDFKREGIRCHLFLVMSVQVTVIVEALRSRDRDWTV